MARRRFDSWHSANRYPWESYEEAKKRYENQYGPIQEGEVDTSWAEEYKREQGLAQAREEEDEEGFLSSTLGEFGSGAAKSWDEFQAGLATKGEHIVAPWLDKLGSLREGRQRAEKYADAIREWAPEYRKKQLEEAAQYPETKTRLQKRQEEDPTYKPAETRAETLARLKEEGGWKYKLAKKTPEFVPLSTEKFAEDFPTAGEMGSYSTSTVIPMAAGGAAALGAYASGLGPIATAGLAMLSGGTAASSMVAAQTADEVKDHPIIRKALEIDPDIPFEKLSPIQQSRINEIASHAAQNNLGMRLISSGIPEMIGYIPAGGWLVRGLADVVGGTTSEVWDIAVSRDSMLDALIDGGVDPNKVAELEQAFIEIGPKKSEVFVKALAGEFVATAGFTSIEQTVKNALPKRDHRVDASKTDTKLVEEKKEAAEKKAIETRIKKVEEEKNKRRVTNELVRKIVELHDVNPEAAVQEFQDLKLAEGRIQNDVASVLAEDNADIFRDISHRIGEGKRKETIDKALDKWERETARIEEKAQKQAERERIQAEKREAKRVADAQKQDVAEDAEADKKSQATTQTVLDAAEATETVVEEPKPKKKAAKKKATKKTAKDLKAEEVRRQDVKVAEILAKPPKSLTKKLKEVAKYTGVEILPTDQPQDVVNKIMAKATEADAVVEEEVAPEVEEEVTPEKETVTVYRPDGTPVEVEVTARSEGGAVRIIDPDTGENILVVEDKYAFENPASPDYVLETEGDTPTVSSLSDARLEELIKKNKKLLKGHRAGEKKEGPQKGFSPLKMERRVNALEMEKTRRAEAKAKAEPKVPVSVEPESPLQELKDYFNDAKISKKFNRDKTTHKKLSSLEFIEDGKTVKTFTKKELQDLGVLIKNAAGQDTVNRDLMAEVVPTTKPPKKTAAKTTKAPTKTPPKTKATKKGKEKVTTKGKKVTTKPKTDADRANEFVKSGLKKWDKKNKLKKDASKLEKMKHKENREAKVQELTTEAVGKIKPKEVDPAEEAFVQRRVDEARAERARTGKAGSTKVDAVIASKEDYSGKDTEKIKKVQVEKDTPDLSVREINIIEQKARAEYQKDGDKREIKDKKGNTKKITQKNKKGNKSIVLTEAEVAYTLSRDEIDTVIDDFKNKTNLKDKDVTFRVLDRNNKEDVNHLTQMVGEAEANEIFEGAEAFVPETGDVIYIIDGNIKGYKKFLENWARKIYGRSRVTSGAGRLINVLFHEVIGHYGLRKFLGDGYKGFINRFAKLNKKVLKDYAVEGRGQEYLPPEIKNIADLDERTEAYDNYDSTKKKDLDFLMAEEYIASHFAEFGARDPNIINRIVVALRNKLSEIPLFSGVTTNQVKTLLAEIQQDYIGGRRNFLLGEDFAPVRFTAHTAQREKPKEKVEEAQKPEATGEAEEEIETLTISQSKRSRDFQAKVNKGLKDGSLESYNMSRQRIPEYGDDPISMERLTNIVVGFFEKYPDSPRVTLIPEGWMPENRRRIGWWSERRKRIYLQQGNIPDANQAVEVLFHEAIGHGSFLEGTPLAEQKKLAQIIKMSFPKEFKKYMDHESYGHRKSITAEMHSTLTRLYKPRPSSVEALHYEGDAKAYEAHKKRYKGWGFDRTGKRWQEPIENVELNVAIEVIARKAEYMVGLGKNDKVIVQNPIFWGKVQDWFRRMFADFATSLGVKPWKMSEDEFVAMMSRVSKRYKTKGGMKVKGENRALLALLRMHPEGTKSEFDILTKGYEKDEVIRDDLKRQILESEEGRDLADLREMEDFLGAKTFRELKDEIYMEADALLDELQETRTPRPELPEQQAPESLPGLDLEQSKLVNDYSLNFSKKTSLVNIPKKTIKKVYKLMEIRDGKLYYPFVEAKGKEKLKRKPQYPVKLGEWLSASFVLPKDMPGQGRGMDLAPRGGFHLTENLTPHLKTKLKDGTTRVWVEVEIGDDVNYQDRVGEKGRDTEFLVKRDKDGNVIDGKVPEGGQYRFKRPAIQGGWWRIAGEMKLLRVLPESESNALLNEYVASKEYTDAVAKGRPQAPPNYKQKINPSKIIRAGSTKIEPVPKGHKRLFNAGTIETDPRGNLMPHKSDWARENLEGEIDLNNDEIDIDDYIKDLVYMSEDQGKWVPSIVSRFLGHKSYPTWDDIREYGRLNIMDLDPNIEDQVFQLDENYWETNIVRNLNGEESKYLEIGQGPEPGDIISFTPIEVKYSLTGEDLVDFLKQQGVVLRTAKETAEGKLLTKINQSKAFGIYARYNKDAGVDGTMLLHRNTRPDEGEYRITFFREDGELDMARTENKMGHEHFPTLDKAKSRLAEVGEGRQDISGGRKVNLSRKRTTFTEELTRAEAEIDPVAFARGAERRVKEGKAVGVKRDEMAKVMNKAYKIDISDEGKLASELDKVSKKIQVNLSKKLSNHEISHGQIIRDPLILDISKIKGISKADLKEIVAGNGPFIFMWDRMRGDGFYKTPSGVRIPLQGGMANSYITYNMLAGIIGSSTSAGNVVTTVNERVKASNGYGIVGLMGTDAHASNPTFHAIYTQVIRDLLGIDGPKRKALVEAFSSILNEKAKEGINPKTGKPYNLPAVPKMIQDAVKGIITTGRPQVKSDQRSNDVLRAIYNAKTPEEKYKIFEDRGKELTFDARGALFRKLGLVGRADQLGIPSLQQMLQDTIDPEFGPAKGQSWNDFSTKKTYNGDLAQVMKFDKNKPISTAEAEGLAKDQAHLSYDIAFMGEPVGRFATRIPLDEGTKEFYKTFRTAAGKKVTDQQKLGTTIMTMPWKLKWQEKTIAQYTGRYTPVETTSRTLTFKTEKLADPIPKTKEARKQAYNASKMMSYNQATVAEGRLNWDGGHWIPTFKWQDKLAHKLTRRLISQGTLTDANVFKDIRRRNKGVIMMAEQAGEKLFNLLRKSKQQQVLFEYFTTPHADATLITNPVERKAAIAAKKQIKQIGRDLVTKGLMTQESLDKFDDQYLPRKYLKYLLGDSDFNAISKGGAGVKLDLGYTKKRGDIPAGIAELIYGEIKDPAYLASISISTPVRDMAILDMFEVIATEGLKENRGWVLPKTLVKFDTIGEMKKLAGTDQALIDALQLMDTGGVKISGHWLLNEAERIQDLVDNHLTLDDKKEKLARALIKSMTNKGKEIVGQVLPKDYRRVPKGRKYGYLSGMAIRKEIFEDLFGWGAKGNTFDINADGTVDQSWAERILGTGGTFETYNRIWKWSKVSANPPSWVRNFISNMIFMSLGPVPIPRLPDLFIRSIADQIKTRTVQARGTQREFDELNTHTKLADKMGLTSGGFSQTELKLIRNDFIRSKNNEKGVLGILKIRDAFKRVGGGIQRSTSDLYGGIDTLGKVMVLKYLKGQGMSDSNAAMQAEKWLFDYSNPLPSVKYLRKSAFGAPFLSYPSFVAPLLIETVIKRPWKFAPYFILAEYLKSTFKEEQDVDDEEYRATMGELSEYLRDKANLTGNLSWIPESVLPLPNLDKQGRGQVIDVGYLFPWGMFAEVFRELDPSKDEGSQITDAFHTVGLLSSPLVNLSTTALTHRDPFTDRAIYDEFATSGEKYASWINYGFNLTMPPMFHGLSPVGGANYGWWKNTGAGGFGALTRLYESYSGKVGREGEPKFTSGQAIARMFGMNVTPIAPFEARAKNVYFEVQKIKKLQRQIAYKYRKGMEARYTKEELKDLLTGEIEKLNNLVKKLNERVGKRLPQSLKRSEKERLRAMEDQLKYMRSLKKAG